MRFHCDVQVRLTTSTIHYNIHVICWRALSSRCQVDMERDRARRTFNLMVTLQGTVHRDRARLREISNGSGIQS